MPRVPAEDGIHDVSRSEYREQLRSLLEDIVREVTPLRERIGAVPAWSTTMVVYSNLINLLGSCEQVLKEMKEYDARSGKPQ